MIFSKPSWNLLRCQRAGSARRGAAMCGTAAPKARTQRGSRGEVRPQNLRRLRQADRPQPPHVQLVRRDGRDVSTLYGRGKGGGGRGAQRAATHPAARLRTSMPGKFRPCGARVRDAACPLSTREGTRLVRLVRGRGGSGGGHERAGSPAPVQDLHCPPCAALPQRLQRCGAGVAGGVRGRLVAR